MKLTESILSLPRFTKRLIAIICDLILCVASVIGAFFLRLDKLIILEGTSISATLISVLIALPIFWISGLYRTIFRFSGLNIIFSVSAAILFYSFIYFFIFTIYTIDGVPRSIGIIQPMLLFFGVISSRLFAKFVLSENYKKKKRSLKPTLIYGAGNAGRQLASSLENNFEFKIVGFLDDDKRLHRQVLEGYTIYDPNHLENVIQSKDVEIVLLALPSISRFRRNEILKILRHYKLTVQTLPSISDLIKGKVSISDIKELDVNDIINREIVPPKKELLYRNITSQVILVTGAGGSIGSEICRQIIKGKPKKLILCEISEFALYKIYEELINIKQDLMIYPILANVQDQTKMKEVIKTFEVNTIYHAAAYKHVPLVEANICEGVLNNVFGTFSVSNVAIQNGVSNFVLISSDKAVRSTNVMGATKRLAELCIQALYYKSNDHKINMSMVRFGNVLESSGSVIPKFKQQIKMGGPITLTHVDVTRYFMTISEAAQLVMQAGAMSKACDVFVLDMGKSIKIKDLIYRIVDLSGLSIKDEDNPNGDIEIKITGLRDGEKLYEELLLGENPQSTEHSKIQKAQDPFIPLDKLEKELETLKRLSVENKSLDVKKLLEKIVSSYQSDTNLIDYIYVEKLSNSK